MQSSCDVIWERFFNRWYDQANPLRKNTSTLYPPTIVHVTFELKPKNEGLLKKTYWISKFTHLESDFQLLWRYETFSEQQIQFCPFYGIFVPQLVPQIPTKCWKKVYVYYKH